MIRRIDIDIYLDIDQMISIAISRYRSHAYDHVLPWHHSQLIFDLIWSRSRLNCSYIAPSQLSWRHFWYVLICRETVAVHVASTVAMAVSFRITSRISRSLWYHVSVIISNWYVFVYVFHHVHLRFTTNFQCLTTIRWAAKHNFFCLCTMPANHSIFNDCAPSTMVNWGVHLFDRVIHHVCRSVCGCTYSRALEEGASTPLSQGHTSLRRWNG